MSSFSTLLRSHELYAGYYSSFGKQSRNLTNRPYHRCRLRVECRTEPSGRLSITRPVVDPAHALVDEECVEDITQKSAVPAIADRLPGLGVDVAVFAQVLGLDVCDDEGWGVDEIVAGLIAQTHKSSKRVWCLAQCVLVATGL